MAENPAGRFHLVEAPVQSPAVDWVTRTSIGPFVDTGVEIKFAEYGRLYLSVSTVRELAEVAGLFDNLESRVASDQLQDEYNRGRDDELKENLVGHLRDVATELVAAADRLAGGADLDLLPGNPFVAAPDAPGAGNERAADEDAGDGAHDGDASAVEGEHEADAVPRRTRGQGNGSRSKRRLADVPSGASDGDGAFRI